MHRFELKGQINRLWNDISEKTHLKIAHSMHTLLYRRNSIKFDSIRHMIEAVSIKMAVK